MIKEKNIIQLSMIIIFSSVLIGSLIPATLFFFICYKQLLQLKNIIILLFSIGLSLSIAYIDVKLALQFLIITSLIILLSNRFNNSFELIKHYFPIYSCLFLIIVFMFHTPLHGSTFEMFTLQKRLWFSSGNIDFNPNQLGIISTIAIFFIINSKKNISTIILLIFMSWVLIATQSRTAIVILLFLLLFSKLTIKKACLFFISLLLIYFFINNIPVLNRFSNEGDSGRLDIYLAYADIIKNNFPLPISNTEFITFKENLGPLDNLYLNLIIKFGLAGLLLLTYTLKGFKNLFVPNNQLKFILYISFYVYGLVESSFLQSLIVLFIFSITLEQTSQKINTKKQTGIS